ncbi:MAG: ketopantoate reductase family protein [Candidatus Krumholzibacteriia bacterium]
MRFVVYGAGAVGGVLGGHLALDKHDVLLICRGEHADVIRDQNGLRMKSATGDYFAPLRAAPVLDTEEIDEDTVVFFTAKSNHTEPNVETLAEIVPSSTPVVCFQNGIANEEIIAGRFDNVLGGVCRMTCSFLQPGNVSFRKAGRLIVGKYPKGADPFARKLGKLLAHAGFDATVSTSIMCDKWLKLVANLQSALHAVIDLRDHESMEFMNLKVGILEEAKRVLQADKIKAKSCDGRDLSVDEIIQELKKPRAGKSVSSVRVNNSTWQNLYLKREHIENLYFHGPIIELGQKYDIATPYNETVLEMVTRCSREGLGPNALRAGDILEQIRKRSKD